MSKWIGLVVGCVFSIGGFSGEIEDFVKEQESRTQASLIQASIIQESEVLEPEIQESIIQESVILESKIDMEAVEFAESLPGLVPYDEDSVVEADSDAFIPRKCPRGGYLGDIHDSDSDTPLKVYISFSVPEATWIEFSKPLEKLGGSFVLKGLPNNSFREFASRIMHLRKAGVLAPITIDPTSCETVSQVPSLSLTCDITHMSNTHNITRAYDIHDMCDKYDICETSNICSKYSDVISGNIPVEEALRLFADQGDTHELAKKYLQKLNEGQYE